MEGATSTEDTDAVTIVEDFDSEGALLDNTCDSDKLPPLARSCSTLTTNSSEETKSLQEANILENMRTRTESSGSDPTARPYTIGAMGHKRTRKRDILRREMAKLRRKTAFKFPSFGSKEKEEKDQLDSPNLDAKVRTKSFNDIHNLHMDTRRKTLNPKNLSVEPEENYRDSGFVEQIFNDAARMTISIDRQLSVDAKHESERRINQALAKVNEMIVTEETYLEDLRAVVEGYYGYMLESKANGDEDDEILSMPEDLKEGKDKIAVSWPTIEKLYAFHERSVLPWMKQVNDKPKLLKHMFGCKEKEFKRFYGEFALNKTKSEAIIVQHNEYFNEIQRRKMIKGRINAQLMTPVQRIIRYPMLLKEICSNFEKAEHAAAAAQKKLSKEHRYKRDIFIEAYNKSQILAEYTDQMLIASRITGYAGKIAGNGILLKSAQVQCQKKKTTLFKSKNEFKTCQIFLFERMILFALVDVRNTDSQAPLEYWTHFKIHQHLRTLERVLDGKHGFELDRNEDTQLKVRKSERSKSNALNPDSYLEFIDQMMVVCKDETLRNEILKLINDSILRTRDYIKKIEMPTGVHRNYCQCFEPDVFDDEEDEPNENDETDSVFVE